MHAPALQGDEGDGGDGGQGHAREDGADQGAVVRPIAQPENQKAQSYRREAQLRDDLGGNVDDGGGINGGGGDAAQDRRAGPDDETADMRKRQKLRPRVAHDASPDKGAPLARRRRFVQYEPGAAQQDQRQGGVQAQENQAAPADRRQRLEYRPEAEIADDQGRDDEADDRREDDA